MRTVKMLVFIIFMSMVCCAASLASAETPGSYFISVLYSRPLTFDQWYQTDKAHTAALTSRYKNKPRALTARLVKEWQALSAELASALNQRCIDPDKQYAVFDAGTSGRIHILNLAMLHRERLLSDLITGKKPVRAYPDRWSGGNPAGIPSLDASGFYPAAAPPVFTAADVMAAVNELALPPAVLRGLTFYMLPFNQKGYAASLHSKFLPAREELICLSAGIGKGSFLSATVAHELGHYVHYQYIGTYEQNPEGWKWFLALTGQEDFNTGSIRYQDNTCELFAEYFRLVYGSSQARDGLEYQSSAPNPLEDPALYAEYRRAVDEIIKSPGDSCYDVSRMRISTRDRLGRPVSYPVGVRPDQITAIVTTSPGITFSSPVILNPARPFVPAIACCKERAGSPIISYSYPPVAGGSVTCNLVLPGPGVYTLYVGRTDSSRQILDPMSFSIIYTGEI